MAGVYGYIGMQDDAVSLVLNGVRNFTGYDSWGILYLKEGKFEDIKEIGTVDDYEIKIPNSTMAFAQTRIAIHGLIDKKNSPPQKDCKKRFYVLHNGLIEYSYRLRDELTAKNHNFESDTDSEILCHLIEENLASSGEVLSSILKSLSNIRGNNSFIIIDSLTNQVICVNKGLPLFIVKDKKDIYISSELFNDSWKDIILLEDEQLAIVEMNKVKVLDIVNNFWITPRGLNNVSYGDISLKEDSWTFKEISEEPIILDILSHESESEIKYLANIIKESSNIYIFGNKGSYAAGEFFQKILFKNGISSQLVDLTGVHFLKDYIKSEGIGIILSDDINDERLKESIESLRDKGLKIISFTNFSLSFLAKNSDICINLRIGTQRSPIPIKSFISTIALIVLLNYELKGEFNSGRKVLEDAIDATKGLLSNESNKDIMFLSKRFLSSENLLIFGSFEENILSRKLALILKKGGLMYAEALKVEDFVDDEMGWVIKNTPCILYAPNNNSYPMIASLSKQLQTRGAFTVGLTSIESQDFDVSFMVPGLKEEWFLEAYFLSELLVYNIAVLRDFEKPKRYMIS